MNYKPTSYTFLFVNETDSSLNTRYGVEWTFTLTNPIGYAAVEISVQGLDSSGVLVDLPELTTTYYVTERPKAVRFMDLLMYSKYQMFKFTVKDTVYGGSPVEFSTVAEIFENTRAVKWSPASFLQKGIHRMYLKAFCNFPTQDMSNIYLFWQKSTDGNLWQEVSLDTQKDTSVLKPIQLYMPSEKGGFSESIEDVSSTATVWKAMTAYPVYSGTATDKISTRADILELTFEDSSEEISKIMYRARMVIVKQGKVTGVSGKEYILDVEIGRIEYTPVFDAKADVIYSEISQASDSKSLRYSGTLYGFGNYRFKNYIVPTYAGESVRPLSKLITLNTYENTTVTSVIPWRDYLVAFTENSTHIVSLEEENSYTKTVNSDIGVPISDYRCCKAILNGVIFKSGSHVYFMYPNIYSGTDTIANLTDISEPVSDYILEYPDDSEITPFAITSDDYYMMFMPKEDSTVCLKYEYNDKRWTLHEYPVVFYGYETFSHEDVRMFGYVLNDADERVYAEYSIKSDVTDLFDKVSENLPYADFIIESSNGIAADVADWGTVAYTGKLLPIKFVLDSGQKTDSKWYTKQFSESKFVVSTMHQKDSFPMQVTVHIDGAPHVHVIDVNTDSSFWKNLVDDAGTLSTNLFPAGKDTFNTYRKMFIRYSGKGTSIRHIIEGNSLYPFKLYDVIYRFKVLNVKK